MGCTETPAWPERIRIYVGTVVFMSMQKKYEAAQKLLTQHTRTAVLNGRPEISWNGDSFSYIRQLRNGDKIDECLVTVNAINGEETTALVPEKTAPDSMPAMPDKTFSPNGKWALETREHDLWLRGKDCNAVQLTFDGAEKCEYGTYLDIYSQVTYHVNGGADRPRALFSPDSRYFITYRADLRNVKTLPVIESCGGDAENLRPKVHFYSCPFAVDSDCEMPCTELYLGDTVSKTLKKLDAPAYAMPVFMDPEKAFARWLEDSSGFWFTWYSRSCTEGRLYFTEAATAETKLLVDEQTDTFHNLGAFNLLDGFGAYQFSNFVTSDRKTAFWQSERSGYAHLYRYDENGIRDLFGEENKTLIVQKLINVDEENRKIFFMANNIGNCSSPLYYNLFSIRFDGSNLQRLTPEDGTHQISMGKNSFVDTWSRVDKPPVTVLRRLDGSLIRVLDEADASELIQRGYIIPERFKVTADDGETELYGIIVRPAHFDPEKSYPVIDYVYGGAQLYNVPQEFTWDNIQNRQLFGGLELFAQLGFVGIIIDGRGTPGRGKAFHNFSYKRIHGCAGLDDHLGAIMRIKEQYPFIDVERVGLWGNSGGGYATVSGLLKYPEFYKVGVASSGNFDQRVYENSWTERYYGKYDPEVYQNGDITALAGNLKGRLLLACGCMDDNVTIWQTFRLCDELGHHNKDYDLIVLPRINHNVPSDLYFVRRKLDYFVRYLMKKQPPDEFAFDCMETMRY